MLDVINGDALETLRQLPDACMDALFCDPPYGLSHEPDMFEVLRHWCAAELREYVSKPGGIPAWKAAELFPVESYDHGGRGFMGKSWDSFVPSPEVWRECMRVLKPGAHALIFGGTRTYDLLVLSLRLAGFQVRDMLAWLYGSGFPKSLNVALAIDKAAGIQGDRGAGFSVAGVGSQASMEGQAGAQPEYRPDGTPGSAHVGEGTALKPAIEPIVLVRKNPDGTIAACVLEHGTGALQIDACRIGIDPDERKIIDARSGSDDGRRDGVYHDGVGARAQGERFTSHAAGRWPANVLFDEEAAAILDAQTGHLKGGIAVKRNGVRNDNPIAFTGPLPPGTPDLGYGDSGGASRFFYCAKAPKKEREAGLADLPVLSGGQATGRQDGSKGLESPRAGAGRGGGRRNGHPTVKPIELLRYLVRLITPKGGTVLVPFAGSGSEVIAAGLEGLHAIGIEQSEEYTALAWARLGHWCERPELAARARAWYAGREQLMAGMREAETALRQARAAELRS